MQWKALIKASLPSFSQQYWIAPFWLPSPFPLHSCPSGSSAAGVVGATIAIVVSAAGVSGLIATTASGAVAGVALLRAARARRQPPVH